MPLPRPQKLLIYLDQNFISDIAKVERRRPEFDELYSLLHQGFWEEKLVVLRSVFHEVETSMAGSLADPIRSGQSTIGHVRLLHPIDVKESQIVRALQLRLGNADVQDVITFDDIFEENPDRRLHHIEIDVNCDWQHAGARQDRQQLADQLDRVRKRIFDNSVSYKEQLLIEMREMRGQALSSANARQYTAASGATMAQLVEFVASPAFERIPIVRLEAGLLARLMTAYANRPIRAGDATDVDAMAAYLPYCDMYAADGAMVAIARQEAVDSMFGCELFSSRGEVDQLIQRVRTRLENMAPVNVPALSVFVAATEDIKENAFNFFRVIGSQAKSVENRLGKWVEVFGFDDGAMPQYGLAPFCGLQEVVIKSCNVTDSRDVLVDACRKSCRSRNFILVDRFEALPNDFITRSLSAAEAGLPDILGHKIYDIQIQT